MLLKAANCEGTAGESRDIKTLDGSFESKFIYLYIWQPSQICPEHIFITNQQKNFILLNISFVCLFGS